MLKILFMMVGASIVCEIDVGSRYFIAAPLADDDCEDPVVFLRSFLYPEWYPPWAVLPTWKYSTIWLFAPFSLCPEIVWLVGQPCDGVKLKTCYSGS